MKPTKKTPGLIMKYFVLKPGGNDVYAWASRRAMREYAKTIRKENPELAEDLCEWADVEWLKVHEANEKTRQRGEKKE